MRIVCLVKRVEFITHHLHDIPRVKEVPVLVDKTRVIDQWFATHFLPAYWPDARIGLPRLQALYYSNICMVTRLADHPIVVLS